MRAFLKLGNTASIQHGSLWFPPDSITSPVVINNDCSLRWKLKSFPFVEEVWKFLIGSGLVQHWFISLVLHVGVQLNLNPYLNKYDIKWIVDLDFPHFS